MKTRQEFFRHYLPYAPVAHALWRCYECERFAGEKLAHPVLDVGCGDGFFAQAVFGDTLEAGIDLDPSEVKKAVRRGAYGKVFQGDVTHMDLAKAGFRTVISNCAVEHIPDIDAALSEISRVLKPGGRLIITVPSEYFNGDSFFQKIFRGFGFNRAAQWYNRALNSVLKHHHVDDHRVWAARFEKAGLSMERFEYIVPRKVFYAYERWLLPAIPSKIFKVLFGRWIFWPRVLTPPFALWWFKDLLKEEDDKGVGYFFVARKKKGAGRS